MARKGLTTNALWFPLKQYDYVHLAELFHIFFGGFGSCASMQLIQTLFNVCALSDIVNNLKQNEAQSALAGTTQGS